VTAIPRILIVDDEPQITAFLSLMFERAGYAVKTACSGRDAIALCSQEPFDVVLSDVMMPEMNGHQLAQWIAAHRPTTRTALMSGFDASCRNCSFSPRCRLIAKPFGPREIISFVAQVLAAS
jgi:two-component system, cell cycle response regulator CpdR